MMKEYLIKVTTTGEAGAAGGTARSGVWINGIIWDIQVDYHASAPNTTTVDIDEVGGQARKILDLAAANTDARYRPREVAHTYAGAAQTLYSEPFILANRHVLVTVALSNALTDAVVVRLMVVE